MTRVVTVALRAVAVALVFGSGVLVYLLGRCLLAPRLALVATLAFLLHPDLIRYARAYRPEAFMFPWLVLGLYWFVQGMNGRLRWHLAGAGVGLGLATLYKLFAFLTLAGCVLALVSHWFARHSPWRCLARDLAWLVGSYLLVAGGTWVTFLLAQPAYYDAVVGHQIRQGAALSWDITQRSISTPDARRLITARRSPGERFRVGKRARLSLSRNCKRRGRGWF